MTYNASSSSAIPPAPVAGEELTREEAEAVLRRLAGDFDPTTHPPLPFATPFPISAERSGAGQRRLALLAGAAPFRRDRKRCCEGERRMGCGIEVARQTP